MRLIRCYIENFGCLSQYALDFAPGLTVLHQPNGFGKTTLAAFLCAMLYGLGKSGRTISKNDRKKYAPWQGGAYGGNLVFEHNGVQYRAERTFGAAPRQDTFALYRLDTGAKSDDFSENLGVELFGLDAESFARSTWLAQDKITGPLATDSIRAKLSDLVEDTGDVNRFEEATKRLREMRSKLVAYRGSTGRADRIGQQLLELQTRLDGLHGLRGQLEALDRQLAEGAQRQAEQQAEREQLRTRIRAASEASARLAAHKQKQQLETEQDTLRGDLEALHRMYPDGMPGEEQLRQADAALAVLARPEDISPAVEKAAALVQAGQARFAHGPSDEELDTCRRECRTVQQLEMELETASFSAQQAGRLKQLETFFAGGVPSEQDLDRCRDQLAQAARLRRENSRLAVSAPAAAPAGKKSRAWIALVAAGIVLLAVGAGMLGAGQPAVGGGALGVGLLALMLGGYLSLRQTLTRQMQAAPFSEANRQEIQRNEQQADRLEQQAAGFLSAFAAGERAPAQALEFVQQQRGQLLELRQQRQRAQQQTETLRRRRDELAGQIGAFLSGYLEDVSPAHLAEQLDTLRRQRDEYRQAAALVREWEQGRREHSEQKQAAAQALRRLMELRTPSLSPGRDAVQTMRNECARREDLLLRCRRAEQQLEQFVGQNRALLAEAAPDSEDLDSLRQQEKALTELLDQLGRGMADAQSRRKALLEKLDQIPLVEDEIDRQTRQRDADRANVRTLDSTMAFLEKARERLAVGYLGKVQRGFEKYLRMVTGEEDSVFVDSELSVQLERGGQGRELAYFSAGYVDMVQLCMRLALVDALFEQAQPLLILDDPFVNLDDAHTRRALELLHRLSADHQILYLVCNSSRAE